MSNAKVVSANKSVQVATSNATARVAMPQPTGTLEVFNDSADTLYVSTGTVAVNAALTGANYGIAAHDKALIVPDTPDTHIAGILASNIAGVMVVTPLSRNQAV